MRRKADVNVSEAAPILRTGGLCAQQGDVRPIAASVALRQLIKKD